MRALGRLWGALWLLCAGACASLPSSQATSDVRAFVTALRDNDRAGIEAGMDRQSLSQQMVEVSRAIGEAESSRLLGNGVLGSLVGTLAGAGLQVLGTPGIDPAFLAIVARRAGLLPDTRLPNQLEARFFLKELDDGRVCAPDPQTKRCLMFFAQSTDSRWRLVAIDPDTLRNRLARR